MMPCYQTHQRLIYLDVTQAISCIYYNYHISSLLFAMMVVLLLLFLVSAARVIRHIEIWGLLMSMLQVALDESQARLSHSQRGRTPHLPPKSPTIIAIPEKFPNRLLILMTFRCSVDLLRTHRSHIASNVQFLTSIYKSINLMIRKSTN